MYVCDRNIDGREGREVERVDVGEGEMGRDEVLRENF